MDFQKAKVCITIAAAAAVAAVSAAVDWRFTAAEQASTNVVIASGAPGAKPEYLWRWSPHGDPNAAKDARAFGCMDECKITDGGKTVLVCASEGGAAAIDIATRRARWYIKLAPKTAGPHSLDMLPDGRVAVACSTGIDKLVIADVSRHPFEPAKQKVRNVLDLPGGHGVVWDAKRGSLFALGYTNLYELAYSSETMTVTPKRVWDYTEAAGDPRGHDFVPDGRGGYFMTNHTGIWRFDPDKGSFTPVAARANVKSFSRDSAKGDLMQVPTERWWSDRLLVTDRDGKDRVVGPFRGARFYKARWIEEDKGAVE